jgi:hypothetical protein
MDKAYLFDGPVSTASFLTHLGGRATLTIEYQNYEILSADPLPETDVGGCVSL